MLNIGNVFYEQGKYTKALLQYEDALTYFEKTADDRHIFVVRVNMATTLNELKQYDKSIVLANKALLQKDKAKDLQTETRLYFSLSTSYFHQNQFELAEEMAKIALDSAKKLNMHEVRIDAKLRLAHIFKIKHNYQEATQSLLELIPEKDSLHEQKSKASLDKLKKEIEQINLNNDKRLADETFKFQQQTIKQKNTLLIISVFALVLSIFAILFISILAFKNYQKNKKLTLLNQALYLKNTEFEKQNIALENKKNEIAHLNENLEQLVTQRTQSLHQKNQQLKEYAFLNSHILRAPVAKILGLHQIMLIEDDVDKKLEIFALLDIVVKELDDTVHLMQEKVSSLGNN